MYILFIMLIHDIYLFHTLCPSHLNKVLNLPVNNLYMCVLTYMQHTITAVIYQLAKVSLIHNNTKHDFKRGHHISLKGCH